MQGPITAGVADFRRSTGPRREMDNEASVGSRPVYHLLRRYKGEVDLLIILRTKKCRYNCSFCDLPNRSSDGLVPEDQLNSQIIHTLTHYADALDVIDRVSISNEGSVLDSATLPLVVLCDLIEAVSLYPSVRRVVLETRPEFATRQVLRHLTKVTLPSQLELLVGFETLDDNLRNVVLGKRQSRDSLLETLDAMRETELTHITSYILIKPGYDQTDQDGVAEAKRTIQYLKDQTELRGIQLSVRLNPMYVALDTRWGQKAKKASYKPPRLTDVLTVAEWAQSVGVPSYIGLSAEGNADHNHTFRARDDFTRELLKRAIAFNQSQPTA